MGKITGETSTGFKYSFDDRILQDWDYLSLLRKLTDKKKEIKNTEKLGLTQDMFLLVLGEEETKKLVEHVKKNNDGFAPMEAISNEFYEILQLKN